MYINKKINVCICRQKRDTERDRERATAECTCRAQCYTSTMPRAQLDFMLPKKDENRYSVLRAPTGYLNVS